MDPCDGSPTDGMADEGIPSTAASALYRPRDPYGPVGCPAGPFVASFRSRPGSRMTRRPAFDLTRIIPATSSMSVIEGAPVQLARPFVAAWLVSTSAIST